MFLDNCLQRTKKSAGKLCYNIIFNSMKYTLSSKEQYLQFEVYYGPQLWQEGKLKDVCHN